MAQILAGGRPAALVNFQMTCSPQNCLPPRSISAHPIFHSLHHASMRHRLPAPSALDPASIIDTATTTTQAVFDVAALDSASAGTLATILRPVLSISSLLMIVRIVMTWYPEIDATKLPWSIAYTPTEPLLSGTRKVVKPFNGLDVSPIVWVALLSFISEILTGPQGILMLIERKGI